MYKKLIKPLEEQRLTHLEWLKKHVDMEQAEADWKAYEEMEIELNELGDDNATA